MDIFLNAIFCWIACNAIRVDPDRLPSIEVLLVPPKHPYPQVTSEIMKLHYKREEAEKLLENQVMSSYSSQLDALIRGIDRAVAPRMKPLIVAWYRKMGMLPPVASFLQVEQAVENVAIHVERETDPSSKVRSTIQAIDQKRQIDEAAQVAQGVAEFGSIGGAIQRAVSKGMSRYFVGTSTFTAPSFIDISSLSNQTSGINPVLNIRIGSSEIGDGLSDGASYPSIVGMVEEERSEADMAEETLLNTILRFSRLLLDNALSELNKEIFPPEFHLPESTSFMQASPALGAASTVANKLPIPPAVARVIRQRAFEHSTVELNIIPPEMDDYTIIDQLNAFLQADTQLRRARITAYMKEKRKLLLEIQNQIDEIIRRAAVLWGVFPDPENEPVLKQIK